MARLGTQKRPAVVRVRSISRAEQIVALCQDHGWKIIAGVEPEEPEDTSDLERLLRAGGESASAVRAAPRIGRNDHCPCGSGKKFKKCCGANDAIGPTLDQSV